MLPFQTIADYEVAMPDWIHTPHAAYVLAAYAAAAVALIGVAVASWREYKCRTHEWKNLQKNRADDAQ